MFGDFFFLGNLFSFILEEGAKKWFQQGGLLSLLRLSYSSINDRFLEKAWVSWAAVPKKSPPRMGENLLKLNWETSLGFPMQLGGNSTTKDFKGIRSYRAEDEEVNLDQPKSRVYWIGLEIGRCRNQVDSLWYRWKDSTMIHYAQRSIWYHGLQSLNSRFPQQTQVSNLVLYNPPVGKVAVSSTGFVSDKS